jgi:hypothetical protein
LEALGGACDKGVVTTMWDKDIRLVLDTSLHDWLRSVQRRRR